MTLLEKANFFPPFLCRLVARKNNGRKAMSHRDIAEKSGMSLSYVAYLSQQTTWDSTALHILDEFTSACGVNHLNLEPHLQLLRRSPMKYLQKADKQQRKLFARLLAKGGK